MDVFVDTWAWYALADAWDADHRAARSASERPLVEGHGSVTTNLVLDEAVTLVRYHIHDDAAVRFWHTLPQLVDGHLLELVRATDDQERGAWSILEQYDDQRFSYRVHIVRCDERPPADPRFHWRSPPCRDGIHAHALNSKWAGSHSPSGAIQEGKLAWQ